MALDKSVRDLIVKLSVLLGFLVATVMLILGGIQMVEDKQNRERAHATCKTDNYDDAHVETSVLCAHAYVRLNCTDVSGEFHPYIAYPVLNWYISCVSKSSAQAWLDETLARKGPFQVYAHRIMNTNEGTGFIDQENVIGWIVMFSIGVAWWASWTLVCICTGCCLCCTKSPEEQVSQALWDTAIEKRRTP